MDNQKSIDEQRTKIDEKVDARIRSNNAASIRLAEKLGFEKNGVIPFYEKRQDTYYDGVMYHFIV